MRRNRIVALTLFLPSLNCSCEDTGLFGTDVGLEVVAEIRSPCVEEIAREVLSADATTRSFGVRPDQPQSFVLYSATNQATTLENVRLEPDSAALTLSITGPDGGPLVLPARVPFRGADPNTPTVRVEVAYQPGSEATASTLVFESDDSARPEVRVPLEAGPGELEVTPARVDFGGLPIGEERTTAVRVTNAGRGVVALRGIELRSTSAEFCAPEATRVPSGAECGASPQCPALAPGESIDVNVRYAPQDGGDDTGTLAIVADDETVVPLSGSGTGPALCVCVIENGTCRRVGSVDFGTVLNGTSEARRVRLESCGTEALELSAVELDPVDTGFELAISFDTGRFEPGQSTEGEIAFGPADSAERRADLVVRQRVPDREDRIPLLANAVGCDLDVVPPQVAFGVVPAGETATRSVLLINGGARPCQVTEITDPDNRFRLVDPPTVPLTVGPGASEVVNVEFDAPTESMGERYTSTFEVAGPTDAGDTRRVVELIAFAGGMPSCEVVVRPSNSTPFGDGLLSFGFLPPGLFRTRSVVIRNAGTEDCTLESYEVVFDITIAGPSLFTVADQPLPRVIAPGDEAEIDVTYSSDGLRGPNSLPIFNHLDFAMRGPGLVKTEWRIALEGGIPLAPEIVVIPPSVDFGPITWDRPQPPDSRSACGSRVRTVSVFSTGTDDAVVSEIALAVSDPLFEITSVRRAEILLPAPYRDITLTPGEVLDVSLRFFPTRANPPGHSGELRVTSNTDVPTRTVLLTGQGRDPSVQTDTFTQTSGNMVDILWVIDDSGSMEDEQARIAQNFGTFIAFADNLGIDYHVAVTTTEVNNLDVAGRIWGCAGFNPVITSGDADRIEAFNCAAAVSAPPNGNTRPNEGGSGEQEAGLQAAQRALTEPLVSGDNAGFLRFDASLAVIVVSDEDDQSDGPVEPYVSFFSSLKGDPNLLKLSAIAGDVSGSCEGADPANRYLQAASSLGGQFESICAMTWVDMLQRIGLNAFTRRTAWPLSRRADPASIAVTVNGGMVPENPADGWTFDSTRNVLTFHGSAIPPANATIQITYEAICQ